MSQHRFNSIAILRPNLNGDCYIFTANGAWPPPLAEEGPHHLLRNNGNDNHWLEIDLEGVVSSRDGIGAKVYVTAGGVTQVREQSGGATHLFSQNHQRLHFGLAEHSTVEKIEVIWPNGVKQEINNISSNQLIRIVEEPRSPFLRGAPSRQVLNSPGVYLWKQTFDGPYKLRVIGAEGELVQSTIELIASDAIGDIQPFMLNNNDRLTTSEFGFSLDSVTQGFQDGVDFQLAPGATALLSVTQDGVANPRQLFVGRNASRLAPAGWILDSDEFPTRPNFARGEDLGLFVGQGPNSTGLEFRWNGDGFAHNANVSVLTSSAANFSPVNLSAEDEFTSDRNEVNVKSFFKPSFDGLNMRLSDSAKVGLTYEQDGFNQPHRVNRSDLSLGLQNAYELPLANPFGRPNYNKATDKGLFLWKDEVTDLWKLKALAGGSFSRFRGSIVTDRPFESVIGLALESSDRLDTSNPNEINFDLKVNGAFEDAIDFRLPVGASAELRLQGNRQLIRVGVQKWQVSALPLDLSGWDIEA